MLQLGSMLQAEPGLGNGLQSLPRRAPKGEGGRRRRWGNGDQIARGLRKRMTPQEVKLWVHLRSWSQRGFHFRRQKRVHARLTTRYAPRDGFIVDFICLEHRLVVEVDGGQHNFEHSHCATPSATITLPIEDSGSCASGTMKSIGISKAS